MPAETKVLQIGETAVISEGIIWKNGKYPRIHGTEVC